MCDVNTVVNQFKQMASLDWAAMANHLTREILVLSIDLPKDLQTIKSLKSVVTCDSLKKKAAKAAEKEDAEDEEENEEDLWGVFTADIDYSQLSLADIGDCVAGVDKWEIGKTVGNLLTRVFARELKPVI